MSLGQDQEMTLTFNIYKSSFNQLPAFANF